MTVTEFLQSKVPFLTGLTPEQANQLAIVTEQKSFAQGQTVLFRGTTVDGLYVVASGKVSVWVRPAKGGKIPVQAAILGPGEVFGETSIVEMGTAGATVRSDEGGTLVFVIPQEALEIIFHENPDLRVRALALIASRKKKNSELVAA